MFCIGWFVVAAGAGCWCSAGGALCSAGLLGGFDEAGGIVMPGIDCDSVYTGDKKSRADNKKDERIPILVG